MPEKYHQKRFRATKVQALLGLLDSLERGAASSIARILPDHREYQGLF